MAGSWKLLLTYIIDTEITELVRQLSFFFLKHFETFFLFETFFSIFFGFLNGFFVTWSKLSYLFEGQEQQKKKKEKRKWKGNVFWDKEVNKYVNMLT